MDIVSFIIPAYNSELTINKCVLSVCNQKPNNWEIVIIDDGSVDNTSAICKKYTLADKRIKYFYQTNSGPGAARNYGIINSTGKYLVFLDSDDYISSNFLITLNNEIEKTSPDIVFYNIIRESQTGKKISICNTYYFSKFNKKELLKNQISGSLEWGMNKVIKKDVIINNKCFFENLNVAEEALFSLKVLKNSNKIVFINQKLYHYVNIPSGQHTKGNNDPWFCLCKIMKKYLIESKEYEEYKLSLNGLIVRSLNISIYRLSSNTFFEFKKNVKTKMANYKIEFGTFDKLENVDKKTRLISFLLKIKFFLIIYLLCKIRNKMVKK